MIFKNDKISTRQLQILLMLNIFGTGILSLPRRAAHYAGRDGFISVAIAVLCAALLVFIIATAARRFPNNSFYEYCGKLLTRPVAFILSMGFAFKLIVNLALELRFFGEVVRQTLLETTPFWVIALLLLTPGVYAASKGYETRARLGELLAVFVFVPILFIFILSSFGIEAQNILPLFETPPEDILTGALYSGMSLTGIELCLLVFPYLNKPKQSRGKITAAVIITGIIMTLITFLTIASFGAEETKEQIFPILQMTDYVKVPGSFFERQKALVMSFWIVSAFFIINAYLFFSSLVIKSVIKKGSRLVYILICSAAVFGVSLFIKTLDDAEALMRLVFITFDMFYMVALPIILAVMGFLRRREYP